LSFVFGDRERTWIGILTIPEYPLLAGSRHSESVISKVLNFRFRPKAALQAAIDVIG
jgi:hypothetical protein